MHNGTLILTQEQSEQKITRLAYEIYEAYYESRSLYLFGIKEQGYALAYVLARKLKKLTPLKITLHPLPLNKKDLHNSQVTLPAKELMNKDVLIIDDVMNSGRVLYYATGLFREIPLKTLNTLVLVNRNHQQFPVYTRFAGLYLSTTMKEHVSVVSPAKGKFEAYLY